jgi:hypothetical protein
LKLLGAAIVANTKKTPGGLFLLAGTYKHSPLKEQIIIYSSKQVDIHGQKYRTGGGGDPVPCVRGAVPVAVGVVPVSVGGGTAPNNAR